MYDTHTFKILWEKQRLLLLWIINIVATLIRVILVVRHDIATKTGCHGFRAFRIRHGQIPNMTFIPPISIFTSVHPNDCKIAVYSPKWPIKSRMIKCPADRMTLAASIMDCRRAILSFTLCIAKLAVTNEKLSSWNGSLVKSAVWRTTWSMTFKAAALSNVASGELPVWSDLMNKSTA